MHEAQPIAHALGVLAFVCVAGMALKSLEYRLALPAPAAKGAPIAPRRATAAASAFGRDANLAKAAAAAGNSLKELDETHFIPFFIGIGLGIVLGTLPIPLPGLPQPLRLGLAGHFLIALI